MRTAQTVVNFMYYADATKAFSMCGMSEELRIYREVRRFYIYEPLQEVTGVLRLGSVLRKRII